MSLIERLKLESELKSTVSIGKLLQLRAAACANPSELNQSKNTLTCT